MSFSRESSWLRDQTFVSYLCHWQAGSLPVAPPGKVKAKSLSHVWFCNPMDCSLPGSSVPGIFPGKSTGVGCHFLLHLESAIYIYLHTFSDSFPISVQFSRSVMSDSLRPHELQHARPPCPSPTPRVHPNSCASSQWCHPAISSSVVPFSSCPQSLPASGSFPLTKYFHFIFSQHPILIYLYLKKFYS